MLRQLRLGQIASTWLIALLMGSSAFATKMDLDTHTAVIQRLTQILQNLDEKDVSKVPSALRLADLLAERSRLKALQEGEKNCNNCFQAKEDRIKALELYEFAIPRLTEDDLRSNSLLQKAHLHFSLGQNSQTEKIYILMTKEGTKRHSAEILGQAHASFGDVYFQKGEFLKAKAEYDKALAIRQTPQRGLVLYRSAWCLFNLNQIEKAVSIMETILQTPKLTEMNTSDGLTQDESFKIDVSKDLASFYARTSITREKINRLMQLSPVNHRQPHVYQLAQETDRLGKKKEAALVWTVYLEKQGKNKNSLEAQIRLMKLKRDMGDSSGALATFSRVSELWIDEDCEEKCDELQNRIRTWVTEWNREEKTDLTPQLTQAYMMYVKLFPDDAEMHSWGAEVAKRRKQNAQALELYRAGSESASEALKDSKLEVQKRKALSLIFEGCLIGEIDMAETLANFELRKRAYKHYLDLHPQGPRQFEVRYQLAQVEFEQKNFAKSAPMFRALALEKAKGKEKLQKTAANISIDSLIQLKDSEHLEKWSLDYAKAFPVNAAEFRLIHRKTVLNTTAAKINGKTASTRDLEKLSTVSMVGATAQDKVSLHKSRYLLALQLRDFSAAKQANLSLLALKELSQADREEAFHNRIWLAELELDFTLAYRLVKEQKAKATPERALRLAWLAQMANQDPTKHEDEFLRLSNSKQLRATIITVRVQRSKDPIRTIKPHLNELSRTPETLARLTLEIYSKTNKMEILEKANSFSSVRKTNTGAVISRLLQYNDLNVQMFKLRKMRLVTRTQNALQKSLESRFKALTELERSGQRAISSRDLVLQAIILDSLMKENQRLHDDIIGLPAPKGLKGAQKDQYAVLIAQQAAPYKARAAQIAVKLNQLWSDDTWSQNLAQNYIDARREYKPALRHDITQLNEHAPMSSRPTLTVALTAPPKLPNEKEVAKTRANIKKNPFDEDPVKDLRDLENRRGNDAIVAHLDARLQQMKGALK